MKTLTVKTHKKNELIDITEPVKKLVDSMNIENGICVLFCPHTTAGLTINEAFDDSVKGDILFSLNKISPDYPEFRHSEGNSDAHIKSSLIGSSVHLIINQGKIILGRWQGIYFAEFDGPRVREVFVETVAK